MNSIVIIPALNPPEHLIFYVDELIESGAAELVDRTSTRLNSSHEGRSRLASYA